MKTGSNLPTPLGLTTHYTVKKAQIAPGGIERSPETRPRRWACRRFADSPAAVLWLLSNHAGVGHSAELARHKSFGVKTFRLKTDRRVCSAVAPALPGTSG